MWSGRRGKMQSQWRAAKSRSAGQVAPWFWGGEGTRARRCKDELGGAGPRKRGSGDDDGLHDGRICRDTLSARIAWWLMNHVGRECTRMTDSMNNAARCRLPSSRLLARCSRRCAHTVVLVLLEGGGAAQWLHCTTSNARQMPRMDNNDVEIVHVSSAGRGLGRFPPCALWSAVVAPRPTQML